MNPPKVNKWLITASIMIPTLIEILDTSVANVALNHIQGSLSAGQEEVTWVLTSYLVANAVVIPMSGWIARFMGRKRYLLASLVVFTLSSMLCGAATSLWQIVLFRIVQGIWGGGLQPMSLAILMETFPPRQRGLAMGIFGMGIVVGPILGPLLGGYFTDNFSWRWIFYINLPIGILALFMIYSFIFDPPYQQLREKGEKVDYIGLTLLCLGLGSLQMVLDKGQLEDWFNSDFIVLFSVVGVASIVFFVFWELRQKNPVLDLRIFKDASFATGNAVLFVGFFSFFGSIVLLPIYLQTLLGYTAYDAGLVLGPAGAISIVILPLVGKATERIDSRFLLGTGLLISAYALYYMSGFNLQIDFETAVISRVIQGLGMPFFFVSLSFVTMAYVPKERMNNASAIFNLLRNMGGSFGVAFVTTVLARRAQFHQHRLVDHLTPYDPRLSIPFNDLKDYLSTKLGTFADQTQIAGAVIYRGLQREAASLAFNDAFFMQALLFLGLLGLLWIIRKPPMGPRSATVGH
ncbi:MAG: DHA2 family efflux MFS transporter permease subunit [Deltaproteobacteria bacterium]|nr:DHA2 family efflux MFS transporter permease subunit [Deltaproteobacteria bacterium]